MEKPNMEKPKEYKCNDFYQAVILKTAGVPLIRLEKTTERFFNFVFDDPEVDARDLIESINELKTRIHSGV